MNRSIRACWFAISATACLLLTLDAASQVPVPAQPGPEPIASAVTPPVGMANTQFPIPVSVTEPAKSSLTPPAGMANARFPIPVQAAPEPTARLLPPPVGMPNTQFLPMPQQESSTDGATETFEPAELDAQTTAASTQQAVVPAVGKLATVKTPNDLKALYAQTRDPYERRYLIAAIPGFLDRVKADRVPEWVVDSLADALRSTEVQMVWAAMRTAGELRLSALNDMILDLYTGAYSRFGGDAGIVQSYAIQAITLSGGNNIRRQVNAIVNNCASYYGDPVFRQVLMAAARYGTGKCLARLDKADRAIADVVARGESAESPEIREAMKKFKDLQILLASTRSAIVKRGEDQ